MDQVVLAHHPHNRARVTRITTCHGAFETPTFMPVGTRAGVNNLTTGELKACGSQIILGGNTYHMLVAPGAEKIQAWGGMHNIMAWNGPMLTDSGGFQVYSLSKRGDHCVIDDDGARFRHPTTHQVIYLNAKTSIETQKIIGADIIMVFDQCTPDNAPREVVLSAMDRTHRWLLESLETHQQIPSNQALFGIIQGGLFQDLREQCTEHMLSQPVDGLAIGGADIGFNMPATQAILDWVVPMLPEDKPRYTMGVGLQPQDLIDVVAGGIDMFDCVAPTRNARHASLYSGELIEADNWLRFDSDFKNACLSLKKACYQRDESPLMPSCACLTCQHYSRAHLHYLYKKHFVLFTQLAAQHNVFVMEMVCQKMRKIITQKKY